MATKALQVSDVGSDAGALQVFLTFNGLCSKQSSEFCCECNFWLSDCCSHNVKPPVPTVIRWVIYTWFLLFLVCDLFFFSSSLEGRRSGYFIAWEVFAHHGHCPQQLLGRIHCEVSDKWHLMASRGGCSVMLNHLKGWNWISWAVPAFHGCGMLTQERFGHWASPFCLAEVEREHRLELELPQSLLGPECQLGMVFWEFVSKLQ